MKKLCTLLRNVLLKRRLDRELHEEVSSYVELLTRQNVETGMTEANARRAALLELGGVEQVKEEVRAARAGFGLETLVQDVRYGLRSLLKKPGSLSLPSSRSHSGSAQTPPSSASSMVFFCGRCLTPIRGSW